MLDLLLVATGLADDVVERCGPVDISLVEQETSELHGRGRRRVPLGSQLDQTALLRDILARSGDPGAKFEQLGRFTPLAFHRLDQIASTVEFPQFDGPGNDLPAQLQRQRTPRAIVDSFQQPASLAHPMHLRSYTREHLFAILPHGHGVRVPRPAPCDVCTVNEVVAGLRTQNSELRTPDSTPARSSGALRVRMPHRRPGRPRRRCQWLRESGGRARETGCADRSHNHR